MKPLVVALVIGAAAAAATPVAGLPLHLADGDPSAAGDFCYSEDYTPQCAPGKLCSQVAMPGVACPWTCGAVPPDGCQTRCKPCREPVCTAVCACEVLCAVGSDGTGVPA